MSAPNELKQHDSSVLDLVFAMDCTGSMGSYIQSALDCIQDVVREIQISEKCDMRLGLVEYRDHPPQDSSFVTRVHGPTASVSEMKSWLSECSANGGGDQAEAVADAMYEVTQFKWREEACKICLMISDAPPHGLSSSGDGFPKGCPKKYDPMKLARLMAELEISLYTVGCEPAIDPYKEFFMSLAYITGAQYVPLKAAKLLSKLIIGAAHQEISMEKWMAEVEDEVKKELEAGNRDVDNDAYYGKLAAKLNTRNAKTKNIKVSKMGFSAKSKVLADCRDMSSVARNFSPLSAAPPGASSYSADMYECSEEEISTDVAEKMVQKAKARAGYYK